MLCHFKGYFRANLLAACAELSMVAYLGGTWEAEVVLRDHRQLVL